MSTTFVVPEHRIPPLAPTRQGKKSEPVTNYRKRTVIVVDDEPLVADSLAEILNGSGFEATPVYSGKAALELVLQRSPDIIITDVVMPFMNGIQVAKVSKAISPETRIVLLSGQAETRDLLHQAGHDGASFELWAKPVHPDILLRKLNQDAG